MQLPRIFLEINEENTDKSGVDFIATVDHPAIEKGYIAFNSKQLKSIRITLGDQKGNFTPANTEKMILAGPLMIPDMDIYRKDETADGIKEYNVMFTKDMIDKIQKKFKRLNYNNNINEMHDPNKKIDGAYLFQDFIIDRASGINPPYNFDLPDGTWFGFVKIDNQEVWDSYIKTGVYTGFSVEGFFYEKPESLLSEEDLEILNEIG